VRKNTVVPEAVVTVEEVKAFETQSGNTRYVLRYSEGREFTTFREEIARGAVAAEGHRAARVSFHEQRRGQFTNVYLDSVDVLDDDDQTGTDSREVEEVAWRTAIDAAPWLLGNEPEDAVPADDLFDRLQPFKERVADDIRASSDGNSGE
jgi:hypothetical protein